MLVIAADWSAAVGRKPNPCEDRCWLAWGHSDQPAGERPDPLYCPTRLEAEAKIVELIDDHPEERVLLGLDFAIGYPLTETSEPVLPVGRDLCAHVAERITDDASGVNNRFHVADQLNREIMQVTGREAGPFWGRPKEHNFSDLPMRRPTSPTGVRQYRAVEKHAQSVTKQRPHSPWKLAGIGSVGSQSLVGLATVHRLLTDHRTCDRAFLWPFDEIPDDEDCALIIAEIYPSLFPQHAPPHWYKDARQVVDSRDALLAEPLNLNVEHERASVEGWILGLPG